MHLRPAHLFRVLPSAGTAALFSALLLQACAGRGHRTEEPPGEVLVRAENALAAEDLDQAWSLLDALDAGALRPRELEKHLFLEARAHYLEGEGWRSFQKLEALASKFPVTAFAPQAAWMEFQIGKALLDSRSGFLGLFSDRGYGLRVLKHLVIHYRDQTEPDRPGNVLADDALALIGQVYWDKEDWEESILRYTQLVQEHPESEWGPLALFRIAMAWFHRVEGPLYDQSFMERAERELALFQGRELGTPAQKKEAGAALERVRAWLAERSLFLARYYATVGSPQGAEFYLDRTVRLYPDTEAARAAEQELPLWKERAEAWRAARPAAAPGVRR